MEREDVISKLECLDTLDDLDTESSNALKIAAIILEKISEDEYQDIYEDHIRQCTECNSIMQEGYCIENGLEYYCCDECLHKNITQEEFDRLYDNGNGDTYYTEWYQ